MSLLLASLDKSIKDVRLLDWLTFVDLAIKDFKNVETGSFKKKSIKNASKF